MKFTNIKLKTLVVDDSSEFRGLLKNHLRHLGVSSICEAESAKRLEEVIQRERPDLVFLDINMPGVSGLEVLPILKRRYPDLYVVIISGEGAQQIVKGALDGGADGYVLKPFSSKIVSEIIETYIKSRGNKEKVSCFLLDDEPAALDLLELETKKLGGEVHKFLRGAELFDALREKVPNILFLDIQMPEMDGFEMLMKVKELYPLQYIIMVSGDSNIDNVKKAIELGADGFLVKPVLAKKLEECINNFRKKNSG